MKKRILLAIGMVMMMGCLTACGAAKKEAPAAETATATTETANATTETATATAEDYVTYEFETYDGENVVIDSSNIVSQEADENPLESSIVPADAEVIAPGRDYVYLADEAHYYVEDAEKNLVTVADKPADAAEANADTAVAEDAVYENDDYAISYTEGTFEAYEVRGTVQLSYCKSDVEAAGSNVIIITKDEATTADDIVAAIVGEDSMDNVSDGTLGAAEIPVKTYSRTSESPADSELNLTDSFMVMQSGDDVITIEIIRTVSENDETEMTIDGAFTHTLESFVLK